MYKFIPEIRKVPVDFDPFAGPPIALTSPTTEPQREVWAASQMGPEASCSYNESVSLELTGPLDLEVLDRAVQRLTARHEGLRTVYDSTGTRSIVLEQVTIPLEVEDLSGLAPQAASERHATVGDRAMHTAFDLLRGPLFRVIVFRHGPEQHVVRLIGHHIVCDGWSLSVMIGDLSIIYSALLHGREPLLPEAVPYSRYAQAMNCYYRSDTNREVTAYWKQLFAAPVPQVDLPTDRPRTAEKTWNATRIDIELPQPLVAGLKELGTRYGSTLVTTLLAVYEVLIARITGQRDIVVGLPAAGQSDMGMRDLVGHCVSLLPIRSTIDEDLPFQDYLKQRRKGVLDAFDHQRFTFSTLLRELNVPRQPGRVPLVPIIFNLDVEMADRVAFEGITHVFKSDPRAYEQFELAMNASSFSDRLVLEWSFNTDLFDAATVRGWMDELTTLVETVIKDPARRLVDLIEGRTGSTELPPQEWSGTTQALPLDRTVATEFDRIAQQYADRPALVQGDLHLTYAELRDRVDSLAHHLQQQGLVPGMPVALSAMPGFDLLIGLLAIVRAGGAFVPIDHSYPEERLRYLLTNCGADLLLTQRELASSFAGFQGRTVLLDDHRKADVPVARPVFHGDRDTPVYVIYTSGSTGEPKGTVVPHRGVLRTVRDQRFMAFGPELTFLLHLSISFDACQIAVMGALLNGGTLVIPETHQPTLQDLMRTVVRHQVNSMATAGGYYKLMIDEHLDKLRGMRHLMTGGDAISVPHVRKAFRALGPGVLINAYGPTENSMLSTYYTVQSEAHLNGPLPIGRPVNNSTVHVLDERMRPVPIGVKGELYTGGPGVALGYWQRPEQTTERFLPDPFSEEPGALLYRTGDMVRWTPEGELEFIGRVDEQVKIRGFRVELGEVEAALNDLGTVKDKAVSALPDHSGEKRLVLHVVPSDATLPAGQQGQDERTDAYIRDVRAHLAQKLPEHMRPMDVVVIRDMPFNANGKPDKKKLPPPDLAATRLRTEHVAPRNELEGILAGIWAKTLHLDQVGVHDNFFEIGGHSLLGIEMLAHVERQLGKKLPVKTMYQSPTVAKLAETINSDKPQKPWKNLSAIQPKGDRTPFFCVHGDEANIFLPKYLGDDQPFYGFFHQGEDGQPIAFQSVRTIAEHFIREMRQVRPHGPYILGGYSFGGIVAFEMACQLAAMDEAVPLVVLFDTYAPAESVASTKEEDGLYPWVKRGMLRRLIKYYFDRGRILPGKIRHFHIIDTYSKATAEYSPGMFPGKVTLIRTEGSPGTPDMGWKDLARDGVEIHKVPGDHYSIIKEPHVRALAREVRASMDQVLRRPASSAV